MTNPSMKSPDATSAQDTITHGANASEFEPTLTPDRQSAVTTILTAGSTLGPYLIMQKLGEGGMGAVYKAQHSKLDKTVAIKVLSAAVTHQPGAVARFEREMKAVGKLNHPNIVQAHDAGEVNGTHYLAMEYVDGTDLAKLVKDRGPMSVVNACKAVRQAALALASAHQAGLVHRDIKPSNLLVAKNGQIKLLDLGLARLAGEAATNTTDLTTAGQTFGTPDYMAPEQWEDAHSADARTDLYALGCTLFFLLTGRTPFGNDTHRTAANKMKGHLFDLVPDLHAAREDAPAEVVAIYHKLMAKKPADRFQTAAELAEALAPFSTNKSTAGTTPTEALPATAPVVRISVAAPPPFVPKDTSRGGRAGGPRRFYQVAAGAAAFVVLLGVIVITITSKDGKKTTVKVPEGTPVEVDAPPESKVSITQSRESDSPALPSPPTQASPAEVPKPAMAPFDAAQAKQHQEAWAAYLKDSVESTNSIGAKMILIPPGEFLMGAPDTDTDATPQEKPQHRVTLTKPFAISATEVTNGQFRQFIEATKYVTQAESDGQGAFEINPKVRRPANIWNSSEITKRSGDEHPVRCVSWEDARKFCEWLSQAEGRVYRLPTEAEWEFACRAGTATRYSFGNDLSDTPSPPGTSGAPLRPVAQLPANPFGLFDMHGSVNEFCLDSGRSYTTEPVTDPVGGLAIELPAVVRGGAISSHAARLRSSNRYLSDARRFPETNFATTVLGFRVVREIGSPPPIAKAPFDAPQARAHQEVWAAHLKLPVEYTNSVGMKLRLIPPGEFLMGSTDEQVAAAHRLATEAKAMTVALNRIQLAERPQHRVVISSPFQFGATEVTNADFRKFVEATQYVTDAEKFGFGDDGEKQLTDKVTDEQKKLTWRTPGYPTTEDLPVTQVSWNDAIAYCGWLSTQEQSVYRLPTEAEWEYACRAGTTSHFSFGDDEQELKQFGWYGQNTQGRPEAVAAKRANGFGLHDMHGNLFEWCHDIFDETWYQRSQSIDPIGPASGPTSGPYYVVRGGFWGAAAPLCRSAFRINHTAAYRHRSGGFRVVRVIAPAQ